MFYLVTQPDNEFSYQKMHNSTIRQYLNYLKILYREINLDADPFSRHNLSKINMSYSKREDIWFLTFAQNPLIDIISKKPGKKFAHVHGLEAGLYEPAVLSGCSLNEEQRLSCYDGIFVNSDWAYSVISKNYPHLAYKTFITGFPFNPGYMEQYKNSAKIDNFIIFNQRFSYEKLHILEVYIADKLIKLGYRVAHICSPIEYDRIQCDRESRVLLNEFSNKGLEVIVANTKNEYYEKLSKASIAITTSLSDTLSVSMLEAIELGLVPIAPDLGPFREYIHPDNLYRPYNIDEIIRKVAERPVRPHNIYKYNADNVMKIYLEKMGLK